MSTLVLKLIGVSVIVILIASGWVYVTRLQAANQILEVNTRNQSEAINMLQKNQKVLKADSELKRKQVKDKQKTIAALYAQKAKLNHRLQDAVQNDPSFKECLNRPLPDIYIDQLREIASGDSLRGSPSEDVPGS